MFDIGFWEIGLICIVALLVVGPERLPGLIREFAGWTKTIRRFVATTKREFEGQLSSLELEAKLKDPVSKNFEEVLEDMDELMDIAPDKQEPSTPDKQQLS